MKVVLDIETIQAPRDEWARLVGKVLSGNEPEQSDEGYDLFAAGAADAQRQVEDEQYAKSAFDGTFSRIVCIGWHASLLWRNIISAQRLTPIGGSSGPIGRLAAPFRSN